MNTQLSIKPKWITADLVEDISDNWMEETDPTNERGEFAQGYFIADSDGELTLRGISVEDRATVVYYDRLTAAKFLTMETIFRIDEITNADRVTDADRGWAELEADYSASWRYL